MAHDQSSTTAEHLSLEPLVLALGKQFHEFRCSCMGDWRGDGMPTPEAPVARSRGTAAWDQRSLRKPVVLRRNGRADILIEYEDSDGLTASVIIEVKNTLWDSVPPHRVRPNLGRQRRQVWGYLEPLILRADAGEVAYPQAFIVYPQRPERAGLADAIDAYLTDEYGIVVTYAPEVLDQV